MKRASLYTKDYFLSSSDDEQSSGSDTDEQKTESRRLSTSVKSEDKNTDISDDIDMPKKDNIMFKLLNRERTGHFASSSTIKIQQDAFKTIPSRLHFCLKDIVPFCYFGGHVFMGLTVCGQFLLSYKVVWDEEVAVLNYNFSTSYKYELFFWIYRPHNLLSKYYNTCLFDDHGLDRTKTVTMTQWKSNPRTLIIHGASEDENEDSSYYTIVSVPKLGCLDCRKLRDDYYPNPSDSMRCGSLCIKCNLTIHTKYTTSESDPKFEPHLNLRCPERIIMFTNGLIHMLNVRLDQNKPLKACSNSIDISYINNCDKISVALESDENSEANTTKSDDLLAIQPDEPQLLGKRPAQNGCEETNSRNIVAQIIADFAECETSEYPSQEKLPRIDSSKYVPNKYLEELQISCMTGATSPGALAAASTSAGIASSGRVRLLSHRSSRLIVRTSNRTPTVELPSSSTIPASPAYASAIVAATNSTKTADKAAKAYEFSEDTDKYEKISSFRKRRLADKKYEFSEDNAENIIPFTKLRMSYNSLDIRTQLTSISKSAALSPCPYGTASNGTEHLQQQPQLQTHTHRASPSHGFRSPCGSPVGNRFMSPPGGRPVYGRSPTYAKPYSSPRQFPKRTDFTDMLTNSLLSPRSDDFEMCHQLPFVQPLSEVKPSNIDTSAVVSATLVPPIDKIDKDEKPMCSKKLIRRYVEEDDATSVITSEEDDCISPGYHTSLPVEVHGSCYSDMQMIAKSSYQQLKCPSVVITQHTFDLETLTFHIANYLCAQNDKKYGFAYDWACEPINICPLSSILACVLVVNFTACDLQPFTAKTCINCTSGLNVDCVFHRNHFECRSLFTWNIENGDWQILDYGELVTVSSAMAYKRNSGELSSLVKRLATELSSADPQLPDIFDNLCILDVCEKSKGMLRDSQNSIQFYRDRRSSSLGSVSSRSSDDFSHFN